MNHKHITASIVAATALSGCTDQKAAQPKPMPAFANERVKITKQDMGNYSIQWLDHGDSLTLQFLDRTSKIPPQNGYYCISGQQVPDKSFIKWNMLHIDILGEPLTREEAYSHRKTASWAEGLEAAKPTTRDSLAK